MKKARVYLDWLIEEEEEEKVKKDIKWLKKEMDSMPRMRDPDRKPNEWFIGKAELLEALNQLDEPEPKNKTPIEDKEEEQKYYLRHIFLNSDDNFLIFNIYTDLFYLGLPPKYEGSQYKFTDKEIKEIEKCGFDLRNFERVE